MTFPPPGDRPPYDERDLRTVEAHLERRGLQLFDPISAESRRDDPHFAPCLAAARWQMEAAFAHRRADGTPFRVFPALVTHHLPNALAVDLGGVHLCAIYEGLVTTVFELAAFVLAQRETFPEIGDPTVETSPQLPPEALLGYWIADRVAKAPPEPVPFGYELVPIDPDRRLAAHFLSQIMLRFVWFHELFHGLNGHSGLLAARGHGLALHEMPELGMVALDPPTTVAGLPSSSTLQAMELDADRTAFHRMIRLLVDNDEPFQVLAGWPLALRLKLATFAAVMMTFLFDQHARRNPGHGRDSHPEPQLRLYNLVATIASQFEDDDRVQEALSGAMVEIDRLTRRVPAMPAPERLMADLASGEVLRLLVAREADIDDARPRLQPFVFRDMRLPHPPPG